MLILWLKKLFIPCRDNNFRPKILEGKYLIYILLLACFLRLSTYLFFWQLPNTSFFADISRMVLIDSLNNERSDLKLGTLKENSLLNKAALLKANDMMQKGYFSHTSPQGITPWYWFKKVGYNYKSAGENLGIGFVDSKELHQAWNESPSHKANLVSKNYKEVGISFVEGNFQGSQTTVVVQLFGTQKSATPKPVVTTSVKPQATTTALKPVVIAPSKPTDTTTTNVYGATVNNSLPTTATAVAGQPAKATLQPLLAGEATTSLTFVSTTTEEEITQDEKPKITGIWASILKFFAKDYNNLTQKIVFAFLALNIIVLILNIIIKIFVQHYDLILKATLISIALILLIAIGPKEITALLQPYAKIF